MPRGGRAFSPIEASATLVCVPHEQLDATVRERAETSCERSPTAIAVAKRSFDADTAHQAGIAGMGMVALRLYHGIDESREGVAALKEKRKPEFRRFVKQPKRFTARRPA